MFKCSFVIDGIPAFRDAYSHYSEYASDRLAKRFALGKESCPENFAINTPVEKRPGKYHDYLRALAASKFNTVVHPIACVLANIPGAYALSCACDGRIKHPRLFKNKPVREESNRYTCIFDVCANIS